MVYYFEPVTDVIKIGKGETRTWKRRNTNIPTATTQAQRSRKPFPLNLYDDNDDEKYLWIKPRLESLVYGTLPPNQLAFDIDTRITEDTNYIYDHSYHQVLVYENMPKVSISSSSRSSNYLCK